MFPNELKQLEADLRDPALDFLDCYDDKVVGEIIHGARIGWYYEDDVEFEKDSGENDPEKSLQNSPPWMGLVVAAPGTENRGGDIELEDGACVVIIERYPTEKCYPEVSFTTVGRLLSNPDLVRLFTA